jgi:RNA ligase
MKRYSYPRTFHLPWSPGATSDDKFIKDVSCFEGKTVIVTEKRDGENTTLYSDGYVHARSIDGTGKEYQSWILQKWRERSYLLKNDNIHICGENLYAKHSITYDNLSSYFEIFGIFTDDTCLGWEDVRVIAEAVDLPVVPVIWIGLWNENSIRKLCKWAVDEGKEGIVVRNFDSFLTENFDQNVAKYVRKNHVTTDQHWTKNWTKNNLKK